MLGRDRKDAIQALSTEWIKLPHGLLVFMLVIVLLIMFTMVTMVMVIIMMTAQFVRGVR